MASSIRNHVGSLVCKYLKTKNGNSNSVLSSLFTLNFEENRFVLKIPEKSLDGLFDCKNDHSLLKLPPDNVINKVEKQEYKGEIFYTFDLNRSSFVQRVLTPVKEFFKKVNAASNEPTIVEYSSPNIAKPFHMGHLRSTVIGQFVANILTTSQSVVRINYLGDWGTQFGLVQAGLEKLSLNVDDLKENPLKYINEAYVHASSDDKFRDQAKEISYSLEKTRDGKELELWKKLREITIKHLEQTYKVLGIQFDEYTWESDYVTGFSPILQEMENKGLVEQLEGQLVVRRGDKKFALMKSDGTSLYLSRDILAALDRYKRYKCSSIKYVIDKSQEDHVDTLRSIVSALTGKDVVQHVKFGKIIGMSTRKGTSVFLSDILDEATRLMAMQQELSPNTKDRNIEVTRTLAISTLVIYLLKQRRTKDITFDWNTALEGKGDSGVKLQYTHSRLCSLEDNCGVKLPRECHPDAITEPEALRLIALLDRHEQIMADSEANLESSVLVKYLFNLCNATSICLKKLPVKGESADLAQQRLLLFHKTRLVLNSSMTILGLKPLTKM